MNVISLIDVVGFSLVFVYLTFCKIDCQVETDPYPDKVNSPAEKLEVMFNVLGRYKISSAAS